MLEDWKDHAKEELKCLNAEDLSRCIAHLENDLLVVGMEIEQLQAEYRLRAEFLKHSPRDCVNECKALMREVRKKIRLRQGERVQLQKAHRLYRNEVRRRKCIQV